MKLRIQILKELIKDSGLKHYEVAKKAGIPAKTLSAILNEKSQLMPKAGIKLRKVLPSFRVLDFLLEQTTEGYFKELQSVQNKE